MTYFAKPTVAIVFGAFFLCAETCLHAEDLQQFTSPLELPVHDWTAGGFLLATGIINRRESTSTRRAWQAAAWAFMLSLLLGAGYDILGEWFAPPEESEWLSEGAFLSIVAVMTLIAACGLVGSLRGAQHRLPNATSSTAAEAGR